MHGLFTLQLFHIYVTKHYGMRWLYMTSTADSTISCIHVRTLKVNVLNTNVCITLALKNSQVTNILPYMAKETVCIGK